jgi:hypothetical protein
MTIRPMARWPGGDRWRRTVETASFNAGAADMQPPQSAKDLPAPVALGVKVILTPPCVFH